MEVFIENICPTASVYDIKRAIAAVLHSSDYQKFYAQSLPVPLNFEVAIFPPVANKPLRGALTLPTEEIGQHFLRDYGGLTSWTTIEVGQKTLLFKESSKKPRDYVLRKITTLPYVDPQQVEEKEKLSETLRAKTVSVRAIQFGWLCRDGVYSVEYEKACGDSGTISFNGDRREFRVRVLEDGKSTIVVIRAAQIVQAALQRISTTETVFLLFLLYSPAYESELELEDGSTNVPGSRRTALRQRLAALNPDHAKSAIYTSLSIRLVCDGADAADNLKWLCRHANIKKDKSSYPVESRDLFSGIVQNEYREWLASLEWELAFQVDILARDNIMDLTEILSLRPHLASLVIDKGVVYTAAFVRHLAWEARDAAWHSVEANPRDTLRELYKRCRRDFVPSETVSPADIKSGTSQDFDCFHAIVTPTTVRLAGPFRERCNRVIRTYAKHTSSFLCVRFVDEVGLQFRAGHGVDSRTFIDSRYGNVLRLGLVLAGRHFNFLGYSQSGLREHSVWFVKSFYMEVAVDGVPRRDIVTVGSIIDGLGNFSAELKLCPARYGACLAQSFSATETAVAIDVDDIEIIEDIMDKGGDRSFTDGIGTMSPQLAAEIWDAVCVGRGRQPGSSVPAQVQVRALGAKGMLSRDRLLQGRKMRLRPSMVKFDAPHSRTMEIVHTFERPGRFYLNRALLVLLEELNMTGGYEFLSFLQQAVVKKTEAAATSLRDAAELFESFSLGGAFGLSSIYTTLADLGIANLGDPFTGQIVSFGVHHVLRDLKYRSRIPVPGGWNLVGIADIYSYLEENEIFACIIPTEGADPIYLHGPTMVARSPVIHRGDVQVVYAIGSPPPDSPFELGPLANSVVFSTKGTYLHYSNFYNIYGTYLIEFSGSRPLASCLGGGDLDGTCWTILLISTLLTAATGDEFLCCDLASMLPQTLYEPAEYGKARRKVLDRPSTQLDIAEFVTEYLSSDVCK
jgi:RNA-dependent RNA polymerase